MKICNKSSISQNKDPKTYSLAIYMLLISVWQRVFSLSLSLSRIPASSLDRPQAPKWCEAFGRRITLKLHQSITQWSNNNCLCWCHVAWIVEVERIKSVLRLVVWLWRSDHKPKTYSQTIQQIVHSNLEAVWFDFRAGMAVRSGPLLQLDAVTLETCWDGIGTKCDKALKWIKNKYAAWIYNLFT